MVTAGVDVGAITAKAAIIRFHHSRNSTLTNDTPDVRPQLLATAVIQAGYNRSQAARQVLDHALAQAGVNREEVVRLVGTGYGRVQVPGADRTVTEITCHARGAYYLCPDVHTVIDIGGQDSKGISVGKGGKVLDFVMNDKCAAGTGRFLEVMAHALEVDLTDFGTMALSAPGRAKISSTCTVFAESEVVTHVAKGVPKDEIIAGIHEAIAARVTTMVSRIAIREAVVLTGGVARNAGIAQMLEEKLGHPLIVPMYAQLAGAIGAALIAGETAWR
ncbi:MAG TPA: 2-hydroxyglutaryl-CoA dehydratase [Chloroflexi bacterium]|nr:2-hydroxyglutaryl-CoA dehydratase [Chloroflexota bacterium]